MTNPSTSRLHRRTIVLSGDPFWCRQAIKELSQPFRQARTHYLPDSRQALLGQEIDLLVVDAFQGFDPDAFGLAAGALCGGGLLCLLVPALDDWPAFDDPQKVRIGVALRPHSSVGGRFIKRLVRIIREDENVTVIKPGDTLPLFELMVESRDPAGKTAKQVNSEQQQAIDAVIKVVTGQRRRPVVLTADRGRGKSAAFGMAAAALLQQGYNRILISGPSIQAVDALFRHAELELAGAQVKRGKLDWRNASLQFIPPDDLLKSGEETDLLLVDEAAAIPTPLLQQLLVHYPRIAFATTVHGYEGTGRGFAVRFNRILDKQTRGWKALTLQAPIRWAADDPLEALVFRMLLLNAAAVPESDIQGANPDTCFFETINRDHLVEDEACLSGLFGLLVLAHYRTRPFDLRHLLDGPNVSIHTLTYKGHIVATALVAQEGGFDQAQAQEICSGKRRPHGHVLPEILAAHLGMGDAARLNCARIMRIAVHPAVQQRGLGSFFVRALIDTCRQQGMDYIGSSFGATAELLRFWKRLDFLPVRLGIKRNAYNGEHSVEVILGISPAGLKLEQETRSRFDCHFVHQLADSFRSLEPELIELCLLSDSRTLSPDLVNADRDDLHTFAFGHRVYETCPGPVWELVRTALADKDVTESLSKTNRELLIMRVLQHRSWRATVSRLGLAGRSDAIEMLRHAVGVLIHQYNSKE